MSVGGRGINPGTWIKRASVEDVQEDDQMIPEDWGWPCKPYSLESLSTRAKEGAISGASDPRAFEKGKWYRFQDASDKSYVYVHNYTLDATLTPPRNFTDLSPREKELLGVFVKDLPDVIRRIYSVKKTIPIVYGSKACCEMIRSFAEYGADNQLLDTSKLGKRITPPVLEEARQAIVAAQRYGKMLCIFIGDPVCDFLEKACVPKNRDTFPVGLFSYGGLDDNMVRDKIYRAEDRDAGQCVVRDTFSLFLLVPYDGGRSEYCLEMSSSRRDELMRIPFLSEMEEVHCHCEEDRIHLLQEKS
eukprot:TRINITY_DN97953_c0_g1_i1.p1 TRINITY_DN97953_c0_g1~~TRINITY_DN97953_c0_g1_i1.p1  ORF type:complete len:302 (-),score=46.12 TRINITY_DN97953_c0_g1_i1:245-1150(-)